MPPIQVKLVQNGPNPVARRVTFGQQPSWTELALRIERLFNIPVQDVGVGYMDRDYDHITATTNEELNDCFENVHNPTGTVRLAVFDINAFRARASPLRSDSPPVLVDLDDIYDERRSRSRTPSPIIMPPTPSMHSSPSSPVVVSLSAPPPQPPSTMPDAIAPTCISPTRLCSFDAASAVESRMISAVPDIVNISPILPPTRNSTPSDVMPCVNLHRTSYRSPTPPCVIVSGTNRMTRNRNPSRSRSSSASNSRERYRRPIIIPVMRHTRSRSPLSAVPNVVRLPRSRSRSDSPSPPSVVFQEERRSRYHYTADRNVIHLSRSRSRSYSPAPRIVMDGRRSRSHSFDRIHGRLRDYSPLASPVFVQVRRRLSRSPRVVERVHAPLRSRSPNSPTPPPSIIVGRPCSLSRSRERYMSSPRIIQHTGQNYPVQTTIPEPNSVKDEIVKELKEFLTSEIKHIFQSEISQAISRIHMDMMDAIREREQIITSAVKEGIKKDLVVMCEALRSEIKDGTEVKDLIGYVNAARVEVAREVMEIREEREQREKSVEGGEIHNDSGQEKEVQVPPLEPRPEPSSSAPIPAQAQALPLPPFSRRCPRRWRDFNDGSTPLPPARLYHYPAPPPRYPPTEPPLAYRHSFAGHPYMMNLPPILPRRSPSPLSHAPPPPPPVGPPLPPPRRHPWPGPYPHLNGHHHPHGLPLVPPPFPPPPHDHYHFRSQLPPQAPPPPAGPLPPPPPPIEPSVIYPSNLGPTNIAPFDVPPLKKLEDRKAALDEAKRLYRERKDEFRQTRDEVRREKARDIFRERNNIQGNESSARLIDFESSDAEERPAQLDSFPSGLPFDTTVPSVSSQPEFNEALVLNLFRRLKVMGFRTPTHPRLPSIVNREISKTKGQNVDEEVILTNILEELLTPEPQRGPLTLNPIASHSTPNIPTRFRGPGVIGRSATLKSRMPGGF